ncbi:SoxW protein [Magnetospirillum sp. LM-5]|uniref:thioredoxin family protein n=1 Tax=Magnetospirillum sp. LM-5 TaxID=2681466 RepID=UPI00137EFE08|nr:thioredoxin family protein [Magnetospirillum sp. LM-5]CAA7620666.1 SoxW protein [Magnetospirillum sp. LM-5]
MKPAAALVAALLAAWPAAAAEPLLPPPVLAEDGFYHPDWFLVSFMDLKEDAEQAAKAGKRLAMVVEQRGCGACKRVHEVNLRDVRVTAYLKAHYQLLQIDLYGSREITDIDGQVLSEKDYAKKLGVRATPTILFFDESPKGGGAQALAWKQVGYLEPEPFVNAFAFVRSKGYAGQKEPDFLAWMKGPAEKVRLP